MGNKMMGMNVDWIDINIWFVTHVNVASYWGSYGWFSFSGYCLYTNKADYHLTSVLCILPYWRYHQYMLICMFIAMFECVLYRMCAHTYIYTDVAL